MKNEIPQKIYYCWFGGEKPQKVLECTNNWRQMLPDYEIIEINETNKELFDVEKECQNNLWFKTCYENKIWALASDYARLKVLYENGGIYFDTDVTIEGDIKSILSKNKLVVGWESAKFINAAIIICKPYDKNIKQMLDFYNKQIWNQPIYTIPQIMTQILKQNYTLNKHSQITENNDILILPTNYFYPIPVGLHDITRNELPTYMTNKTITVHWNSGNWSAFGHYIIYFGKNKHKHNLEKLLNYCFKNKVIFENNFLKVNKQCTSINLHIDFYWLFRFKYRSDKLQNRWLVLFILGFPINLWIIEKKKDR